MLVGREDMHPGLVCLNFADGRNSRDSQKRLLPHALKRLADIDPVTDVAAITLDAEALSSYETQCIAESRYTPRSGSMMGESL